MQAKPPVVRQRGCILCCACRGACPTGAITMQGNLVLIDPERCDGCGTCVAACVPGALVQPAEES